MPNRPPLPVLLSPEQDGVIQGLVMAVAKNTNGSCWSLPQLYLGKGCFKGSAALLPWPWCAMPLLQYPRPAAGLPAVAALIP